MFEPFRPEDSDAIANAERTFNQKAGEDLASQMKDWAKFGKDEMRKKMLESLRATSPEIAEATILALKKQTGSYWEDKVGRTGEIADNVMGKELDTIEWLEDNLKKSDRLAA